MEIRRDRVKREAAVVDLGVSRKAV
uniref:Uncharacterized protein n=1 Tax=mine drainage metagenome TaxID=410659 RepID=E6QVX6_9ZZZZ